MVGCGWLKVSSKSRSETQISLSAPYWQYFMGNVFLAMDFYKGIISLSTCFSCLSFPDTTSFFGLSGLVNPIGQ